MRDIETNRFGRLRYEDDQGIEFPNGLPGFESEREFVLVERLESRPFLFLQSARRPALCFVTVPVPLLAPGYELDLSNEDCATLNFDQSDGEAADLDVLAIVCAMEDRPATVNLLGPVVICRRSRRGVQTIRDDNRYSARHRVFQTEPDPCL